MRNTKQKKSRNSPQWLGTTWALLLRDLMAWNLASSPDSRASNSLSFLNSSATEAAATVSPPKTPRTLACSAAGLAPPDADAAGAPSAEAKLEERLDGAWRALVNGPLWIGGWEREDFSRLARFEGADEEPEEPRFPDFRFWPPARRRDEVGSVAGESPLADVEVPASRRFSSIEGFLRVGVSVRCVAFDSVYVTSKCKASNFPNF